MPAIDGSTVKQKLFLIALLVIAVAWPFMVSRGTVDIATLTMIYIILGLGLNVVVGLSGLLVLGYGGFYAIGAYTFALLNHYYGLGFWTCLPLAGLVSAAAGFLLGFPVLRLRGDYGDCDLRLRRDRAHSAAQQYRDHRRAERHQPDRNRPSLASNLAAAPAKAAGIPSATSSASNTIPPTG